MKITPLFDRVVIKQQKNMQKNSAGLILAESSAEKPLIGKVVEVASPTSNDSPPPIKPNDTVIFSKYAGNEFKIDGEEFIVLRVQDILAKIED